jgi:CHAT domain-containing protein
MVRSGGRGVLVPGAEPHDQAEKRYAAELYRQAFGPIARVLENRRWSRVIFVADAPVLGAPIPALIDSSGERLLMRYPVSTAVSLLQSRHTHADQDPRRRLLVVGDPLRDGERRLIPPDGGEYGPLLFARQEAGAVARQHKGSLLLSGLQAREADVKRTIGQFGALHFATHGVLSEDGGLQSGLVLATEPEDSGEDGLLQAWEIAGLRLSARIAVLSACETARGDEQAGEGLIGLAWAFQAAGCPNVIASLWNVDDAATRDIMTAFYRELRRGRKSEDALRAAMLRVRATDPYKSPYYWAAFQSIGVPD